MSQILFNEKKSISENFEVCLYTVFQKQVYS